MRSRRGPDTAGNPVERAGGERIARGHTAEDLACRFLLARGLELVQRNFHCRSGEIDLVMLERSELVFVEVRYRAAAGPVSAVASISPAKQRRLLRTGAYFLHVQRRFSGLGVRFDVVALTGALDDPSCEWIRQAFTADGHPGF